MPPINKSLDFFSVAFWKIKRKRGYVRMTIPKNKIKNAATSISFTYCTVEAII